MSENEDIKLISLVDSTHRISWEVTEEKFENCNFLDYILSSTFTIDVNGKESDWSFMLYPKGCEEEKNDVFVSLCLESEEKILYKVVCELAIKTQDGYWPQDFVKNFYLRGSYDEGNLYGGTDDEGAGGTDDESDEGTNDETEGGADDESDGSTDDEGADVEVKTEWSYKLCTTEEFERYFVENKVTIAASLVIYMEGDKYRNHMQVSDEFVDNMRSISSQKNLTDFTIISGNERFPCHRVLLAVRSEYFEALFRNDPTKTEIQVEEAPELVETMLNFMSKGCIPEDVDDKAMDLILVADMYRLNLLTIACETSLVNNLTTDNALVTLITIDKVNHVSKQKHRRKVLTYIKKEASQVVKSKDWKMFVQNYPDLVAEILVFKCCKEHGMCSS